MFVPIHTSLLLFSIGKITGWYKLGLVRLILCFHFILKNIRDRSQVGLSQDIFIKLGCACYDEISQFNLILGFKYEHYL